MFGVPLHPLVVHFPIVLSVFFPVAVLSVLFINFRIDKGKKYWTGVLLFSFLLAVASVVAGQSGEANEEKVESVLISESPLEEHEESAELFVKLTIVVLVLTALGFTPGKFGLSSRVLLGAGSLVLLILVLKVGHTGGSLVYKFGAASAFVEKKNLAPQIPFSPKDMDHDD